VILPIFSRSNRSDRFAVWGLTDFLCLGRGVFASRDIPARTVLEVSPVLVLDPSENEEHIRKTDLYNYT
jgi:hypothetical protein